MGPASRPGRRGNSFAISRHIAPEVCWKSCALQKKGAGNAGCTLHPRSRVQNCRKLRTRAYRAAEAIRHSLRNGFTAYNALSPVIGFLATVIPEKLASHELDASAAVSGPHVF